MQILQFFLLTWGHLSRRLWLFSRIFLPSMWFFKTEKKMMCIHELTLGRTSKFIPPPWYKGGGGGWCHILNHSNSAYPYMYMYMAVSLGMSKKKQLTCWRFCRFCPFCKYNIFTRCYICVTCKLIFPHKLYPFSSFISWWIKSHTSNFSFSPLNRVDVCRERFFNSKWICKRKQSIFTINYYNNYIM